jgi:2-polyprenyl-3-methyl-5-hydroxy-6-metoxy-1,4-benzoquinol methylase
MRRGRHIGDGRVVAALLLCRRSPRQVSRRRALMQATEHWDNVFSKGQAGGYSRVEMPDLHDPVLQRALKHFGSVENKTVFDLGCGRGATSLFFAYHGANVISVDASEVAIRNLSSYCQDNGVRNITPMRMPAQEISKLGQADFMFGSMILHHIEPFDEFSRTLRQVIKPGGKGFFYENNARSKTMIWFRRRIVGKLWVPKWGDSEEFPLMPDEVKLIERYFRVDIEYPELLFFRMASAYLLRGHLKSPFQMLDDYFYRYPAFRQYSYRQYVCLS